MVVVGLAAGGVSAQDRQWGLTGTYGEIVASDCVDCGDDVGITIMCQGDRSNAHVEVPFVAATRFSEGALPITLTTDRGESFSFEGSYGRRGLVGYVPEFELPANHPLVDALASASTLQVSAGGLDAYLGLAGSRQAMTIFAAHCGWTQMPAYVADAQGDDGPGSDARWMIEQAVARDGTERLSLAFGIPETDAVLLTAVCDAGLGTATVEVAVDFGGLPDAAPTDLQIATRSGRFTYPGTVFFASEEAAGVRIVVGGKAPLWRALQATDAVGFSINGGPVSSLTAGEQDGAVASFVEGCFSAVAASQPVAVPAAPRPSVEQPVAVPIPAAPNPVALPETPVPVAEPAAPVAVPATPPAATGSGSYACTDGKQVIVAIDGPASAQVATVTGGSETPLVLNGMPPSPSVVFAAGDAALVLKPNAIQLVQGETLSDCTIQ